MQGGIPLLSLLMVFALAVAEPRRQDASVGRAQEEAAGGGDEAHPRWRTDSASFLYPGYAAFPISAPPRIAPRLAKPLVRNGTLEPGYFILHFRSSITPEDEACLDGLQAPMVGGSGGRCRWAIPHDALVVWVDDAASLRALLRWERTDWIGRYQPAYKIDPALAVDTPSSAPLRLDIDLVPGHPTQHLLQVLEDLGARVERFDPPEQGTVAARLLVEATLPAVEQLAWIEGIRTLQEHVESALPASNGSAGSQASVRSVPKASSGSGGSNSNLVVPTTLALGVTGGSNPSRGALNAGDVGLLRSSDDNRFAVRKREQVAFSFDRTVPVGATLLATRIFVEHHELPRVLPGDVLWKLGHGSLTSPIIDATTIAPRRDGASQEGLDLWTPGVLVPDANALEVVIQNNSQDDDLLVDRIYVEVDYLIPDAPPRITSVPNPAGTLGQAYAYDADRRAEASGTGPILWSVASGPTGCLIDGATGLVSWAPGSTGSFTITLRAANALGSATQQFLVQVGASAPLPPTILPSNSAGIAYCPPERLALGPAASQQRLNVFLPPGAPPAGGWPVVLNNRAGGGLAFAPLGSLSSTGGTAPLHALVSNRIAVVDFGVTAIANGQGLFYPPGHPSGRYESFRAQDDNPEKEAEWAIQWLKTQNSFPLDASRICVRGSSEGAIIAIWATMGPERARAFGSPQVRSSTRVKAVLALQPPTSMWAFDQSPNLNSQMLAHFEQQRAPGVPATALAQVAESLQKDGSILRFAFDTAAARANNEAQAICLIYNEPVKFVGGAPADLALDATGFPRLFNTLGQPFLHDSWEGYVFYKRLLDLSPQSASFHGLRSIFAVRDTAALAPPFAYHTRTYSGTLTGSQANALAQDWVLQTLTGN